jgi:hypothetical protein
MAEDHENDKAMTGRHASCGIVGAEASIELVNMGASLREATLRSGFVKGALGATFLFAGTHGVAAAELRLSQPAISTIPECFILVAKKKKE